MNAALAAGLLGIELPHRLFSLWGFVYEPEPPALAEVDATAKIKWKPTG